MSNVTMMERLPYDVVFDRTTEDVGNIIQLAHVNIWVQEPHLGHLFYICGLGLTRDPFGVTGISSMWANVGRQQFHLPWGEAPPFLGKTALVLPDREVLLANLTAVQPLLEGTRFGFVEREDRVEVTCPWGNRFVCFPPDVERFGLMLLGIPYVEFYCKVGGLEGVARFYREILDTPALVGEDAEGPFTRVNAGPEQFILYREAKNYTREFWGHHIQITLADFAGPHARLKALGLITEETNQHQYRFENIIDLGSGEVLFTTQHETRSMRHPHYGRDLINRVAWMDNTNLLQGYERQPAVQMLRYARVGMR